MQKNLVTKSFEQIQTTVLPKEIIRIVSLLAREILKTSRGRTLAPKQLEAAYAKLHMRIYQNYGPVSKDIMDQATTRLEKLLSGGYSPLSFSNFRKSVTERFF